MKSLFSILSFALAAHAAPSPVISNLDQTLTPQAETQCRAEAKEAAVKTYQSCVGQAKSAQIEELRKEFQAKVDALKAQYEAQIAELKKNQKVPADLDTSGSPQPAVPKTLPSKVTPTKPAKNLAPVPAKKTKTAAPLKQAPKNPYADMTEPTITLKPAKPAKGVAKSLPAPKEISQPAKEIPIEMPIEMRSSDDLWLEDRKDEAMPVPERASVESSDLSLGSTTPIPDSP